MQVPPDILKRWLEIDAFEIQYKGETTARIGLTVQAYVFDSDTVPVRQRLLAAANLYRERTEQNLQHRFIDPGHPTRYQPLSKYDLTKITAKILDNPHERFGVYFYSGKNDARTDIELAQQYQGGISFCETWPECRSPGSFICNVPFCWMKDHSFVEFVHDICECLSPIFLCAGAGFVVPVYSGVYMKGNDNPSFALLPYALKYPAVLCSENFRFSVADGFYSINWLTALGDEWLAKLGGQETLQKSLQPESMFPLRPYSGGILIQAGKYPQMDDKYADEDAPAYRTVNRALRPLRISEYNRSTLLSPPPMGHHDDVKMAIVCQQYLTRFD